MNKIIKSMLDLKELEEFAGRKNRINGINPVIKIVITFLFIIMVALVPKYGLQQVILLSIYPILMMIFLDVPFESIGSKLLLPILFSAGFAIFNPFFDRDVVFTLASFNVTGGMISFVTILLKSMLTFSSTILLVITTTINDIGKGLKIIGIPKILVMLIIMTYRYIEVLTSEVFYALEAYQLRSSKGGGIHISSWGSFVGNIIIKSYKRSREIYQAMQLRGFQMD